MKDIIDLQRGSQSEGTERRNRRNSSTGKDCELLNRQTRDAGGSETANQYKCVTPTPGKSYPGRREINGKEQLYKKSEGDTLSIGDHKQGCSGSL